MKIPTPTERRMLRILLWTWVYYGQTHGDAEDCTLIEHRNMSAGEEATELLAEYGFAEDQGYCCRITPLGAALMQEEEIDPERRVNAVAAVFRQTIGPSHIEGLFGYDAVTLARMCINAADAAETDVNCPEQ